MRGENIIISQQKIAEVNFEGFGEPRKKYKTYYFNTTLLNLKKGEIVLVDSRGEIQKAKFLGYVDKNNLKLKPTKSIVGKCSDENVDTVVKLDRYTLEHDGVTKICKHTKILIDQIMEFHKSVYIDTCLENRNFEDIKKLF